jgi:crotonobetainyl-CoA:carnitine CoA-transferase CaiB-like acyl-CoA transferase
MMSGVFDGLRVLDLSWGMAGPMASMLLVDNGAAVTRIEPPGGDPFAVQSGYRVWHRGKRSARLDLHSDSDRSVFFALATQADIVLDSFSPGTMSGLGIDHSALSGVNPRLITCSITGYGEEGRDRDRPALDALVAARTGLLYDQKGRRGTPMEYILGRPGPLPEFDGPAGMVRGADRPGPVFPRTPWPSVGAAYLATLGIAAALRAREVTGRGQRVTTSLLQGALAAVSLNWQRVERPDAPLYWMWPLDSRAIEGIFECADGRWVHHWTLRPAWVLRAAEGDDLSAATVETAYRDDPDRVSMEDDGLLQGIIQYPDLAAAFKKFPAQAWVDAAGRVGFGISLIRSPAEALSDPLFIADGCVAEVDDPEVGPIRHVGQLLDFSATPGAVRGHAPRSGEHSEELRAEAAALGAAPAPRQKAAPPAADPGADTLAYPLAGVRVLDLGLGVAGPYTGRMLADLGADVIKVNALYDSFWNGTHMGLGINRGKRSISLNLKDDQGKAILHRLIAQADVVTTNWRPGAAARLGIDYASLRERFPRLVFCNTRGYEKGPRSALPGTDQNAAALTGTEWEDGACDAGNPPLWSRSNMGDTGNALLAAIAITSALFHRDRTGQGQEVATAIVNAGLLHTSYAWVHADGSPGGYRHVDGDQVGFSAYYRMYRAADDRWLFVAALSEHDRKLLVEVTGGALAEADDAVDGASAGALAERFAQEPAATWATRLEIAGVPAEVVDEEYCRALFDDPEARRRNLVAQTWSGSVGRFEDPGLLVQVTPGGGTVQRGPCMCGEHTREILLEHGFTDGEVDSLAAAGAILDAPLPATGV